MKHPIQQIKDNMLGVTAIDGTAMVSSREQGWGFVYLIESKYGVKIGITINPQSRIRQLQNSSGTEFSRIALSPSCSNFREIEKQLHNIFAKRRKIGEWFDVKFDDVLKLLGVSKFVFEENRDRDWGKGELEALMDILYPLPTSNAIPITQEHCWMVKAMNGIDEHDECALCGCCKHISISSNLSGEYQHRWVSDNGKRKAPN